MYIISYDIASKSLAVSILHFNDNWKTDFQKIKKEYKVTKNYSELLINIIKYLGEINDLLDNIIKPIFMDVVDLIPNEKVKDVNLVKRTARLAGYLNTIDKYIEKNIPNNESKKVLLEYQMSANDKSRNVCSQILYHYSNICCNFKSYNCIEEIKSKSNYDVELVGASLKNKMDFVKDKTHADLVKKYVKSYDANKNHSKCNFLYWCSLFKHTEMIKNIKKKNLDDIADSVNMAIAWLFKQKMI